MHFGVPAFTRVSQETVGKNGQVDVPASSSSINDFKVLYNADIGNKGIGPVADSFDDNGVPL